MPLLCGTLLIRFLLRCVRGHVRRDGDVHGRETHGEKELKQKAQLQLSLAAWEAQRDK